MFGARFGSAAYAQIGEKEGHRGGEPLQGLTIPYFEVPTGDLLLSIATDEVCGESEYEVRPLGHVPRRCGVGFVRQVRLVAACKGSGHERQFDVRPHALSTTDHRQGKTAIGVHLCCAQWAEDV